MVIIGPWLYAMCVMALRMRSTSSNYEWGKISKNNLKIVNNRNEFVEAATSSDMNSEIQRVSAAQA